MQLSMVHLTTFSIILVSGVIKAGVPTTHDTSITSDAPGTTAQQQQNTSETASHPHGTNKWKQFHQEAMDDVNEYIDENLGRSADSNSTQPSQQYEQKSKTQGTQCSIAEGGTPGTTSSSDTPTQSQTEASTPVHASTTSAAATPAPTKATESTAAASPSPVAAAKLSPAASSVASPVASPVANSGIQSSG